MFMKKMLNTKSLIILLVILLTILTSVMYVNGYKLRWDQWTYKKMISDTVNNDDVKILYTEKIDNIYTLFYQYDNESFGIAVGHDCKLGIFCDIEYYYFGQFEPYTIQSKIIHTLDGSYLVLFGHNATGYRTINYTLDAMDYSISVPNKEYFMVFQSIPDDTDSNEIPTNITLK